jgi:hypothetical protein
MEQQTIEAASTSEAVNFITYVQGLKRKMKSWEKQVNLYREGQRILERQRFQFPSAWLHVDNIEVGRSGNFAGQIIGPPVLKQCAAILRWSKHCIFVERSSTIER